MNDDAKRRVSACFDVLHSTMALLWREIGDHPDAKVILGKAEFGLLSQVRRLRVLFDIGYGSDLGPQCGEEDETSINQP